MRWAWLALALSACAYTPTEFRDAGTRQTFSLRSSPEAAVLCMARNIEGQYPALQGTHRPLGDGQELIVRIGGTGLFAVIAEAMPKDGGSEAAIWLTPNPMYRKDTLVPLMIEGC